MRSLRAGRGCGARSAGRSRLAAKKRRARRQEPAQGYLAAHGLEKSYGGRKVVNGVSLYVRRGEAVGLLGPNGAGKTTAFYTITGLIKPERGQIELDGYDVTKLPMYQRARLGIGYLPQEASIFRGLNVEDNIRAVLEVVEPDRRRREADLNALLDEFEITPRRKTPTIALSGGERRRVEIARALASRPNYMLLDEPFAGIDPKAVVEIQRLVRRLTTRGIGVLITDHNVRETLALTDRSYIIYSGEVLMEGRQDDIVNDPAGPSSCTSAKISAFRGILDCHSGRATRAKFAAVRAYAESRNPVSRADSCTYAGRRLLVPGSREPGEPGSLGRDDNPFAFALLQVGSGSSPSLSPLFRVALGH